MRRMLLTNMRDLGIFFTVANGTNICKEYLSQLIVGLLIVLMNSLIIPSLVYLLKKLTKKLPPEIQEIIEKTKKDLSEEILKSTKQLKEDTTEDSNSKEDNKNDN